MGCSLGDWGSGGTLCSFHGGSLLPIPLLVGHCSICLCSLWASACAVIYPLAPQHHSTNPPKETVTMCSLLVCVSCSVICRTILAALLTRFRILNGVRQPPRSRSSRRIVFWLQIGSSWEYYMFQERRRRPSSTLFDFCRSRLL